MNYNELDIAEGGSASREFENLYKETNQEKMNSVRENLLKYCKMDTYAMVKILEELEKV